MPVLTASPALPDWPFCAAVCGNICTHKPSRMSLTKMVPLVGSVEMPPQFMPPSDPGKLNDLSVPGAV